MTDNLLLHMQQKVVQKCKRNPTSFADAQLARHAPTSPTAKPASMFRTDSFAGLRASHLAQTSIIRITTA